MATINVLHVEDEERLRSLFAELVRRRIRTATVCLRGAPSIQDAIRLIEGDLDFQVAILDGNVQGGSTVVLVPLLRSKHPRVQIVAASGDDRTQEQLIKAGAPRELARPKPWQIKPGHDPLDPILELIEA